MDSKIGRDKRRSKKRSQAFLWPAGLMLVFAFSLGSHAQDMTTANGQENQTMTWSDERPSTPREAVQRIGRLSPEIYSQVNTDELELLLRNALESVLR